MSVDLNAILRKLQAMVQSFLTALPGLLLGVLVFVVFVFIARGVSNAVRALLKRTGQPEGVAEVFSRLASWGVLLLGGLVALTFAIPSLNAASLFGALGVSSVAIGFAFKDIFQNLLAGLLILITRPFRIGDQIVSGDDEGTVEQIQVRATLIRTYDNRQVVIPNSELYTNRVTVNTAYDRRRLSVTIGIGYGDDIAHARRVIVQAVRGVPGVLDDPAPDVLLDALEDSTVNLKVRFWVSPPARREAVIAQDAVLEAVKNAVQSEGIDLPFPTTQLLFHDQTEESDGDRTQQREGWPARKANPASRQQNEAQRAQVGQAQPEQTQNARTQDGAAAGAATSSPAPANAQPPSAPEDSPPENITGSHA